MECGWNRRMEVGGVVVPPA
ncbi:uncharacterized protein G2W53_010628 [Senna tora]|uniref:Uncharacterized protein n=1 Tax=Senna tora TaxID=362788 RepID=A0A835C9Y4_9FABA|nr:uncharacterized protein G2W53_010628 [Senna tora]